MTVATSPSVAFGEGRRPESATHVTLPAFDGPLALLLAVIEARQLDVLTVPLGALADAGLAARAVALVREQAAPSDPEFGAAFLAADEAC